MISRSESDAGRLRALDREANRMGTSKHEGAIVLDQTSDRAQRGELIIGVPERVQQQHDVEQPRETLDLIESRDVAAQEVSIRRRLPACDVVNEGLADVDAEDLARASVGEIDRLGPAAAGKVEDAFVGHFAHEAQLSGELHEHVEGVGLGPSHLIAAREGIPRRSWFVRIHRKASRSPPL